MSWMKKLANKLVSCQVVDIFAVYSNHMQGIAIPYDTNFAEGKNWQIAIWLQPHQLYLIKIFGRTNFSANQIFVNSFNIPSIW